MVLSISSTNPFQTDLYKPKLGPNTLSKGGP